MEASRYIRENKGFSFLNVPRELCALFILFWGINPASFTYQWAVYAAVILLWVAFAMMSQWKKFWDTIFEPVILLSFCWPVLLGIYSIAGHAEFPFHHLMMPIFYVLFWFYYKLEDNHFSLKLLGLLTAGYYVLINVGTLLALRKNPDVSRFLAGGVTPLTLELANPLVGGFQHIYSLTMFTVALVGIIWYYRPALSKTLLLGATVLLGLLTILKSNYSFAILFVGAFCLLVLCRPPKGGGKTVAVLLVCFLLALVVLPNLYKIFYFIADNTGSLKMQLRFREVGNLLQGSGITQGSDAGTRVALYTASLKTWTTSPLFGIGDWTIRLAENPREIVGGHSVVCDFMAYYGLAGSVIFHSILISLFVKLEKLLDRRGKFLYLVVFVLYYVQITVNTGYNEALIEVLFFLIPSLLLAAGEPVPDKNAECRVSRYIR